MYVYQNNKDLLADAQILGNSDTPTESCSSNEAKIYGGDSTASRLWWACEQQGEGAVGCLA